MCVPLTELYHTKFPYGSGSATNIVEKAKDGRWDDMNVTEYLGITKHEADQRNDDQWWKRHRAEAKPPKKWYTKFRIGRWFWKKFIYKPVSGPFPAELVPKTDETRVQILGDVLEKYKGIRCQYTEKLDGSSITFWKDKKDKLHVCSRNRELFDKTDFMYATIAEKYADKFGYGFVYQGEILGPNIQGNKYGVRDYQVYIYQAYCPETKVYLAPEELSAHLQAAGLPQVPILGEFDLTDDIDALVDMSIGMSVLASRGKDTQREGIVIRPLENIDGLYDGRFVGGRLSFKAINPKFLVKYNL
jgi:RNA ligase (TIGR02306 family)